MHSEHRHIACSPICPFKRCLSSGCPELCRPVDSETGFPHQSEVKSDINYLIVLCMGDTCFRVLSIFARGIYRCLLTTDSQVTPYQMVEQYHLDFAEERNDHKDIFIHMLKVDKFLCKCDLNTFASSKSSESFFFLT